MISAALRGPLALVLLILAACGSNESSLKAPYTRCVNDEECAEGVCDPSGLFHTPNTRGSSQDSCVASCSTDADCPPLAEGAAACVRGECVPACEQDVEGMFLPVSDMICIGGEWSACAELSERPCRCNCGPAFVCPPRPDGQSVSNEYRELDEVCVAQRIAGEPCDADWQCDGDCSPLRGSFICVERPYTRCDASTFCDCEVGADGTGYCKQDCQSRFEGNTCAGLGNDAYCDTREPPLDPNRFVPDPPYTSEGRCYLRCEPSSPDCPSGTTCSDSGATGANESGTFDIYVCRGR